MAKGQPPPLPWTQFSYDDFFRDQAVACMTNEEVGAYLRLLHAAWVADPPGHLPNDATYLSHVSGMLAAWPEHAKSILRAFKPNGDMLIQKRIVEEYNAAAERRKASSAQAKHAAQLRWCEHAASMPTQCSNMPDVDVDVDVDVDLDVQKEDSTETSKAHTCSISSSESETVSIRKQTKIEAQDWTNGFNEFWNAYPRKVGKKPSLKVWLRFQPKDYSTADDLFSDILEAVAASQAEWHKAGTEDRFIPHPATWLNQERWRDHAEAKT